MVFGLALSPIRGLLVDNCLGDLKVRTESLRQAPRGPWDFNPDPNIPFSVGAHCVLLPVKQEEGRPASARLTCSKH